MKRKILVALSDVPMFDVFEHEGKMYRKQKCATATSILRGQVRVAATYKGEEDGTHLIHENTKVLHLED